MKDERIAERKAEIERPLLYGNQMKHIELKK